MRILFIGDYSNLHACLAKELKKRGYDVTVMSDRCTYMDTHSDIFIERKQGKIGSIKYLFDLFSTLPKLKGYDVVQLINPNFLSLRPGKIKYFFEKIKNQNRSIFLTLAGNDHFFVNSCVNEKIFNFSEFKIGERLTSFHNSNPGHTVGWLSATNRIWNQYLYDNIDGGMSVLPEYDIAARPILNDRLVFTNLPIDLSSLPYSPLSIDGQLRIFIGIRGGMEIQKGTAEMLAVAKELEREMPDKVKVEVARNLSLTEYIERMKNSHLVLDQLYSYSPATNALQAMALGRVAGSGAEPEYYQYIGNPTERPIFHLSPLIPNLKERIRAFTLDPTPLYEMSRQGRQLVEKHNDVKIVADRFLDHWSKVLESKN